MIRTFSLLIVLLVTSLTCVGGSYRSLCTFGYDGSVGIAELDKPNSIDVQYNDSYADFQNPLNRKIMHGVIEKTQSDGTKIFTYTDQSVPGIRWKYELCVAKDGKHLRINCYTNGMFTNSSFYTSDENEWRTFVTQNQGKSQEGFLNMPSYSADISSSSSSRSSEIKSVCPKCGGRKWRNDSHAYQVNADDYHHNGGSGCPYCSSTTNHWHSHCHYCNPDGTVTNRR